MSDATAATPHPPPLLQRLWLVALVGALWSAIAYGLAATYYDQVRTDYLKGEMSNADLSADELAGQIARQIDSLQGISATLARVDSIARTLAGAAPVKSLASTEERRRRLNADPAIAALNRFLMQSVVDLRSDILFAIDRDGICVAASNSVTGMSAVGV